MSALDDNLRKAEAWLNRFREDGVKNQIGGEAVPAADGSTFEIAFQNENLIARRDGEVVAIVPDLICVVDHESAEPITTEGLRYGQRVRVLGISTPDMMRTPAALAAFGIQTAPTL